jgi:hypothetical protein
MYYSPAEVGVRRGTVKFERGSNPIFWKIKVTRSGKIMLLRNKARSARAAANVTAIYEPIV